MKTTTLLILSVLAISSFYFGRPCDTERVYVGGAIAVADHCR